MDLKNSEFRPASGQQINEYIDQALDIIKVVESRETENNRRSEYARLLREILVLSKAETGYGVVKIMLSGDLGTLLGIKLDGRYWLSFLKWFYRFIYDDFILESKRSGIPALIPTRLSDRKGGYSDRSEAVIYLTFDKTNSKEKIDNVRTNIINEEVSIKNNALHIKLFLNAIRVFASKKEMDLWKFGISMGFLSIILFSICNFLPDDSRRNIFISAAIFIGTMSLIFMERSCKIEV